MILKEKYKKEIISNLKEKFGYKNIFSVPKMTKVTINVGLGAVKDSGYQELVEKNLTAITGQKPVLVKAKKSIAGFKIREGMIVGMMMTLRGDRMYDFVDKLVNVSLPRVRDFRGILPKSVDEGGNLSIGIKEHIIFPEIHMDDVERIHGLQAVITTTAKSREEGFEMFKLMGFPFKKK
jgi:large subunit ribosomal protein L5